MALTAAEKQRRYRERRKNNPVKEMASKKKDLERYHAKKRLVKDLTPREHRTLKKKWRIANAKRRDRRRALRVVMNTPESTPGIETPRSASPINDGQNLASVLSPALELLSSPRLSTSRQNSATPSMSSVSKRGRNKVKRDRSKLYRENLKLKEEIKKAKKRYEKYKKRYSRAKNKELKKSDDSKGYQKYVILSSAIKDRYKKIKNRKEKHAIQKIFEHDSIKDSRKKVQIIKECLDINQGYIRKQQPKLRKNILRTKITDFFHRDDVSRATADKKETKTLQKKKIQRRYLLDNMNNLFQSFKRENPNLKCSYTSFTRCRPFYVLPPTVAARETCLCRIHTNIQYMASSLYKNKVIPTSDLNNIIVDQVCDPNLLPCMSGTCSECHSKKIKYDTTKNDHIVKYSQWERKSEVFKKSGKTVKVTKNIKEETVSTVKTLIEKFEETLKEFKTHVYNIKTQYRNYRACIDGLSKHEIALHVDFSENYNCKCFQEIQSHHFGGSRKQVSLHTGVMYNRNSEDKLEVTSFCTVSGNITHNPAAIWAHLHPILCSAQENYPEAKTLHVFSDGPATQYRQKQNFYLICNKLFSEYHFTKVTWNFFEAGHGKGAADGVGGFLKRAADQLVAHGTDISDASDFYLALNNVSKVKLNLITGEDIERTSKEIPEDIVVLNGTMRVHQVFTEETGVLKYRELSCFCRRGFCTCMDPKDYCPLKPRAEQPREINHNDSEYLADITNMVQHKKKSYYNLVYPSSSDSDEDTPLSTLKDNISTEQSAAGMSSSNNNALIEKENIHVSKIRKGVHVLVKVSSSKQDYVYLGMALSDVEDDGEVKIMFFKSIDDTGKKFKLVETDLSYESYDNLLAIVPEPKKVTKGKRVLYYEFDTPLDIFEK